MGYEKTGNHRKTGKAGRFKNNLGGLQGKWYYDQQCHGLRQPERLQADVPWYCVHRQSSPENEGRNRGF